MKLTKEQLQYFTEKYLPLLPKETHDTEADHLKADRVLVEILLELGLQELVETYSDIDKWYA